MKVILVIEQGAVSAESTTVEVEGLPHVVEELIKGIKAIVAEKFPYAEIT